MDGRTTKSKKETGSFGPRAYLVSTIKKLKPISTAKRKEKEADSIPALPMAVRPKESSFKAKTKFKEKTAAVIDTQPVDLTNRYRTILIQEGMGNFGDAYFYTAEALQTAAAIFAGKKIYANHPSSIDEESQPERRVQDILGHFENVQTEQLSDGRTILTGDVVMLESERWAIDRMNHSLKYAEKFPGQDFIGLSINAMGGSEEMPITDLMKMNLAESILPKIQEAMAQGIETVKVVKQIDDATSCDLVTEAGAGGKVLKFLESNKLMEENMAKKKVKEADDASKKVPAKKDDEVAGAKDSGTDADGTQEDGDDGHDDAAQDKELIKKMIKKHVGGDEEPSEEECGVMKQAYEAAMEMGHKEDEAETMAASHLKLSKHMASKQAEAEEADKAKEEAKAKEDDVTESDDKEEKKESAALRAELLKAKGELAKFKETARLSEVEAYKEKICKESKLHNSVTKTFKEQAKDIKSKEEVQKAWKLFEAGFKSVKTDAIEFGGLIINPEKTVADTEGDGKMDFSTCQLDK